ncbi:MAG TPA: ATP-dependent helicase [Verrucomicrobia bacterium]|nr:MAG: helicase [Lentisphaerae bacterium GWF2_57_35]HBA82507.1 ATP-dependent helicase [Verrucomicrobiota bacterium]
MTSQTLYHSALVLNPHGHLVWEAESEGAPPWPIPAAVGRVAEAAAQGSAEVLLHLGAREAGAPLPPAVSYWAEFAKRYLAAFCRHPQDAAHSGLSPVEPPDWTELEALAGRAPPMRGGEYLSVETLRKLWVLLDDHVRAQAAAFQEGVDEYLRSLNPIWRMVGRVCFHLAENRKNESYPFAFLATYSFGVSAGGRVQHRPLGQALQEYAGDKNRAALLKLLTPVHAASEKSAWVKRLLESGDLFKPLAWRPAQAFEFLQDVPALDASGVVVRLPDWWKGHRPSRPKVSVRIGGQKQSSLGLDALMGFSVSATLDGEPLTTAEWKALMESTHGLALIRGKWVEVDGEKLREAMAHWKRVETQAGEGLSFIEGMRLLAGLGREDLRPEAPEAVREWVGLESGPWLEEALAALREPARLGPGAEAKDLRATLRPYQQSGVQWLDFMSSLGLGACLADDMGLGKTIQVLAMLLRLKSGRGKSSFRPSLLVAPASLLSNWRAEIEQFAPSLTYKILHPSEVPPDEWKRMQSRPEAALKDCDLALTTYGMTARWNELKGVEWEAVILDEAQAIKNAETRQARAVKELRGRRRLVLTGTPIENRLSDLWSLFDFLNPGLLGSAGEFRSFVKNAGERGGSLAALRTLVRPYILRRLKTDKNVISDLPDKTEVRAFCGLSKKQAALYEQSVRELAEAVKNAEGIQRKGLVLAFIVRFKQICNHPSQWLHDGGFDPEESGKFERLRGLVEEIAERQEKALIFTQFQEMTEPLAVFLAGLFGRPGLILHGGISVKNRRPLVEAFQREDGPPFFILTTKAGGAGLNLTEASHVIHFDRWWNPAVENQATDRAFRIGQKKNVLVHKFVCRGTIEERIDEMIAAKTQLADEVIAGGAQEALLTEMNNDELIRFVSLDIRRATEKE